MKLIFSALFVLCTFIAGGQTVRTDTLKPGYYIPFDSNFVSCKVAIAPKGKKVEFTNTTGNRIPDSLIGKIGALEKGSIVTYSEVTVLNKGVLEKAPSVRYYIGNRNSVYALRDPSIPDTIPAAEIAKIVLDRHVFYFEVSFAQDGNYYSYALNGNGVCCDAANAILKLKPGTRVWLENIKRKEDDGSIRIAPPVVHVVR
jgi:hypothetical protein